MAKASSASVVVATLAGAATGWATWGLLRSRPSYRLMGAAAGLVGAAAIYPAARRSAGSGGLGRELAVVAGATCAGLAAARAGDGAGSALVGAGWIGHAFFDLCVGPDEASRLPRWYPALCAGYDVTLGGALLADARRRR